MINWGLENNSYAKPGSPTSLTISDSGLSLKTFTLLGYKLNIAKGENLRNGGHGAAPYCSKGNGKCFTAWNPLFISQRAVLPVSGMVPTPTGCPFSIAHSWYLLSSGLQPPLWKGKRPMTQCPKEARLLVDRTIYLPQGDVSGSINRIAIRIYNDLNYLPFILIHFYPIYLELSNLGHISWSIHHPNKLLIVTGTTLGSRSVQIFHRMAVTGNPWPFNFRAGPLSPAGKNPPCQGRDINHNLGTCSRYDGPWKFKPQIHPLFWLAPPLPLLIK